MGLERFFPCEQRNWASFSCYFGQRIEEEYQIQEDFAGMTDKGDVVLTCPEAGSNDINTCNTVAFLETPCRIEFRANHSRCELL